MKAIISTLAHYEAERGLPLSAFEIFKYLHKSESESMGYLQILKSLWEMKQDGIIKSKNGFYFLSKIEPKYKKLLKSSEVRGMAEDQSESYSKYDEREPEAMTKKFADFKSFKRIEEDKLSISKWKRAKKMLWLMQIIPFIRSISISGSLSLNSVSKNSDIDIFLTVKKGRIWTTRTLSMLLTQAFLQRRHDKKVQNKLCLNHFISEDSEPQIKNMASANLFLRTVPVVGVQSYKIFYKEKCNWIEKYFCHKENKFQLKTFREVKENLVLKKIKKFLEFSLSGKVGNTVEKFLSSWQKKRIEKKIARQENVTNLIFTDDDLMFHWPNPRNKEVLEKYSSIMAKY